MLLVGNVNNGVGEGLFAVIEVEVVLDEVGVLLFHVGFESSLSGSFVVVEEFLGGNELFFNFVKEFSDFVQSTLISEFGVGGDGE